jgi:signal transduction histidine kinase
VVARGGKERAVSPDENGAAAVMLVARFWPALVALALIAGAWGHGRHTGVAACEAAHARAMDAARDAAMRAAELASRKEAERLAAEAERDAMARDLEDQANADPATGDCLSVDRVRRLNLR